MNATDGKVPLVVDLDGTLTPADVSLEAFVRYAKGGVLNFLRLLIWLLRGRSVAKAMVARALPVDASKLPLRDDVLRVIQMARNDGRTVILASASHRRNIVRVARATGLFDDVIGTTARANLKGAAKLAAIQARIGNGPFEYIGDSRADLPVWSAASQGYSCGYMPSEATVTRLGDPPRSVWRAVLKSVRLHQWAKNALILVPLGTAGEVFSPAAVSKAVLAAVLFSLVASAIYQLNDLLDIDADRAHKKKKNRPIAAGHISIPLALGLASTMLLVGAAVSQLVLGTAFSMVLATYVALTTAYSLRLKAAMTLDVITLACLYTIRIIAGAVAINVVLSFWLLLFSIFFFLSLGYLKRYTELADAPEPGRLLKGRGYIDSDILIVAMCGIAAGMVSILVLALFINDPATVKVYATPSLLWGLCLGLLYWINRVWMMARRGEVDGDPVAFAIRDPRSIIVGALIAVDLVLARFVVF